MPNLTEQDILHCHLLWYYALSNFIYVYYDTAYGVIYGITLALAPATFDNFDTMISYAFIFGGSLYYEVTRLLFQVLK